MHLVERRTMVVTVVRVVLLSSVRGSVLEMRTFRFGGIVKLHPRLRHRALSLYSLLECMLHSLH